MNEQRDIDRYQKDYCDKSYSFEEVLAKFRKKNILGILGEYKPRRVLEIGCGTDSIFNYYQDYDRAVIVEPSEFFADTAVKNKNEKITVYKDFIENKIDELKKVPFDFVILSSLLHEFNDPDAEMKKIVSLLNNDTVLLINVPNSRSFLLLWAYEAGLIKDINELTDSAKKFQRHSTFNTDSLSEFVERHGLEICDKGSYFIKPFDHPKMQKLLDSKLIDDNLLDGLYAMTKYFPQAGCEIFVNCILKQV